jgi:hypothetical protein
MNQWCTMIIRSSEPGIQRNSKKEPGGYSDSDTDRVSCCWHRESGNRHTDSATIGMRVTLPRGSALSQAAVSLNNVGDSVIRIPGIWFFSGLLLSEIKSLGQRLTAVRLVSDSVTQSNKLWWYYDSTTSKHHLLLLFLSSKHERSGNYEACNN